MEELPEKELVARFDMNKKFGVCGDSFMAATYEKFDRGDVNGSEGKHFTQILANRLDYEYFTLARGSSSNTAIALQIEEMVKYSVDFIIFIDTSPIRIEIPIIQNKDGGLSIYDIDYTKYPDLSALNKKFKKGAYISETITNIIDDNGNIHPFFYYQLDEYKQQAIKLYATELFCPKIRMFQEQLMFRGVLDNIIKNKIPFIYISHSRLIDSNYYSDLNITKRLIYDEKMVPCSYQNHLRNDLSQEPRRWHTGDEAQVLLADLYYKYITENNLLNWS